MAKDFIFYSFTKYKFDIVSLFNNCTVIINNYNKNVIHVYIKDVLSDLSDINKFEDMLKQQGISFSYIEVV